jgi:hypothetical protein
MVPLHDDQDHYQEQDYQRRFRELVHALSRHPDPAVTLDGLVSFRSQDSTLGLKTD